MAGEIGNILIVYILILIIQGVPEKITPIGKVKRVCIKRTASWSNCGVFSKPIFLLRQGTEIFEIGVAKNCKREIILRKLGLIFC